MMTMAVASDRLAGVVAALDAINDQLGTYERLLGRDLVDVTSAGPSASSFFELRCLLAGCAAELDRLRVGGGDAPG